MKEQKKNIEKANSKGLFSSIKKWFKKKEKATPSKATNFKKEGRINVNQFIVETTNVSPEIREAYVKMIQDTFEQIGMDEETLNDPKLRKKVGKILKKAAQNENEIRQTMAINLATNEKVTEEDKIESKGAGKVPPPPPPPPIGFKPTKPTKSESEKKGSEGESITIKDVKPASSCSSSKGLPPPPPPPPPMGGTMGGKVPPPPPKVEIKKIDGSTFDPHKKSDSPESEVSKSTSLLDELKKVKLNPVAPKKEATQQNSISSSALSIELKALLEARHKELHGAIDSGSSAEEDSDSSEFD